MLQVPAIPKKRPCSGKHPANKAVKFTRLDVPKVSCKQLCVDVLDGVCRSKKYEDRALKQIFD